MVVVDKNENFEKDRLHVETSQSHNAPQEEALSRIITLIRRDIHDLESVLVSTTNDPWQWMEKSRDIYNRRDRCMKLLETLQDCLYHENQCKMKALGQNPSEDVALEKEKQLIERTKMSDDIFYLLQEKGFIHPSEFAAYLETANRGSILGSVSSEHLDKRGKQHSKGTQKKKESRSVRQLRKIYDVPR